MNQLDSKCYVTNMAIWILLNGKRLNGIGITTYENSPCHPAYFISSCAFTANKNVNTPMKLRKTDASSSINSSTCLHNGGVIKNVCMLGTPACIQTYVDAGKSCSDSSECSGECTITDNFVDVGNETIGFCSVDNDPCGCSQLIVNGKATPALCID